MSQRGEKVLLPWELFFLPGQASRAGAPPGAYPTCPRATSTRGSHRRPRPLGRLLTPAPPTLVIVGLPPAAGLRSNLRIPQPSEPEGGEVLHTSAAKGHSLSTRARITRKIRLHVKLFVKLRVLFPRAIHYDVISKSYHARRLAQRFAGCVKGVSELQNT